MSDKDGGPAFPSKLISRVFSEEAMEAAGLPDALAFADGFHAGMTLRDYFAAQALVMAGAMFAARSTNNPAAYKPDLALEGMVEISYAIADAMLKERAK